MALTKAKLAKFSDTQLEREIISAKHFINQYQEKKKDFGYDFLHFLDKQKIHDTLNYYHEEYGKLLKESYVRIQLKK